MPPRKADDFSKALEALLASREAFSTSDLASRLGTSRQAVHKRLMPLVAAGTLVREGAGRSARYRRPVQRWVYARAGLEEHAVWEELEARFRALSPLSEEAAAVLQYVFTEVVNNAIDHSRASRVEIRVESTSGRIAFEVLDDGIGAFQNVVRALHLASPVEAIQELSKGKLTTAPEMHTGEGLFFSSKAGALLEVESAGVRWIVDNERGESAVGQGAERAGTRVRFEIDPSSRLRLEDLFEQFTEDFQFTKTQVVVKLFELGTRFVSRSEARRLLARLERFRSVRLDFHGVNAVGQGFVDEVFRVWAAEHPQVQLEPVNMNPAVEFMVRRGLPGPASS